MEAEDFALEAKDWRADPTTSGSSLGGSGAGGGGGGMGGGASAFFASCVTFLATGGGLDANCDGGGTGDTDDRGGFGAGATAGLLALLGLSTMGPFWKNRIRGQGGHHLQFQMCYPLQTGVNQAHKVSLSGP